MKCLEAKTPPITFSISKGHIMVYECLVPKCVLERIKTGDFNRHSAYSYRFKGAMLFPDISGFTNLSEKFAAEKQAGAERLSIVMNSYFTMMLDIIFSFHGDVIKFAGDALQVIWPLTGEDKEGDLCCGVARCGWHLVQQLDNRDVGFDISLRLKATMGSGVFVGMHVGTGERWEYCVAGKPLKEIAAAESGATPGDFVVTSWSWDSGVSQGGFTGSNIPAGGGVKITSYTEHPHHLDLRRWKQLGSVDTDLFSDEKVLETVSAYVNDHFVGVLLRRKLANEVSSKQGMLGGGHPNQREDGKKSTSLTSRNDDAAAAAVIEAALHHTAELRSVSIVFGTLQTLQPHRISLKSFQSLVSSLFRQVQKLEGQIRQLIVDDKGVVLIALFGMPPLVHANDSARAVKAGLAMVRSAKSHSSKHALGVGVTYGEAFVGGVGSGSRFEYAVMGDVVNMSARLSCKALGEVWVSPDVREQAQQEIVFEAGPAVKVKGKELPVQVWKATNNKACPNNADRPPDVPGMGSAGSDLRLFGREDAVGSFSTALAGFLAGSKSSVVAFQAAPGMGSTRMLEEAAGMCKQEKLAVVRATALLAEAQSPYFALRPIMRRQALQSMKQTSHPDRTSGNGAEVSTFSTSYFSFQTLMSRSTTPSSSSRVITASRVPHNKSFKSPTTGRQRQQRGDKVTGREEAVVVDKSDAAAIQAEGTGCTVERQHREVRRRVAREVRPQHWLGRASSLGGASILASAGGGVARSGAVAGVEGGGGSDNKRRERRHSESVVPDREEVASILKHFISRQTRLVSSESARASFNEALEKLMNFPRDAVAPFLHILASYVNLPESLDASELSSMLPAMRRRVQRLFADLLVLQAAGQTALCGEDSSNADFSPITAPAPLTAAGSLPVPHARVGPLHEPHQPAPRLAVLVDAAHYLDTESLRLLSRLLRRHSPPVLVVLTTNTLDLPHLGPFLSPRHSSVLNPASHKPPPSDYPTASVVRMEPLHLNDIITLSCAVLEVSVIPRSITDFVFEKAQGSPLLTLELVTAIKRAGLLVREEAEDGPCKLNLAALGATSGMTRRLSMDSEEASDNAVALSHRALLIKPCGTPNVKAVPSRGRIIMAGVQRMIRSGRGGEGGGGRGGISASPTKSWRQGNKKESIKAKVEVEVDGDVETPELLKAAGQAEEGAEVEAEVEAEAEQKQNSHRRYHGVRRGAGVKRFHHQPGRLGHSTEVGGLDVERPASDVTLLPPVVGPAGASSASCSTVEDDESEQDEAPRHLIDAALNRVLVDMSSRGVVMSRVGALESEAPELVSLLKIASVIGKSTSFPLWQEVVRLDAKTQGYAADTVASVLSAWRRDRTSVWWTQLMYVSSPGESHCGGDGDDGTETQDFKESVFYFRNEFVQQAFYNLMLPSRRETLHRAVAQHLETLSCLELPAQLHPLVHHWRGAGQPDRVRLYCAEAGRLAQLNQRYDEAVEWWTQSVGACEEEVGGAPRAAVLMGLAEAHAMAGEAPRAVSLIKDSMMLLGWSEESLPFAAYQNESTPSAQQQHQLLKQHQCLQGSHLRGMMKRVVGAELPGTTRSWWCVPSRTRTVAADTSREAIGCTSMSSGVGREHTLVYQARGLLLMARISLNGGQYEQAAYAALCAHLTVGLMTSGDGTATVPSFPSRHSSSSRASFWGSSRSTRASRSYVTTASSSLSTYVQELHLESLILLGHCLGSCPDLFGPRLASLSSLLLERALELSEGLPKPELHWLNSPTLSIQDALAMHGGVRASSYSRLAELENHHRSRRGQNDKRVNSLVADECKILSLVLMSGRPGERRSSVLLEMGSLAMAKGQWSTAMGRIWAAVDSAVLEEQPVVVREVLALSSLMRWLSGDVENSIGMYEILKKDLEAVLSGLEVHSDDSRRPKQEGSTTGQRSGSGVRWHGGGNRVARQQDVPSRVPLLSENLMLHALLSVPYSRIDSSKPLSSHRRRTRRWSLSRGTKVFLEVLGGAQVRQRVRSSSLVGAHQPSRGGEQHSHSSMGLGSGDRWIVDSKVGHELEAPVLVLASVHTYSRRISYESPQSGGDEDFHVRRVSTALSLAVSTDGSSREETNSEGSELGLRRERKWLLDKILSAEADLEVMWGVRPVFMFYAWAYLAEAALTMWESEPEKESTWLPPLDRMMRRVDSLVCVLPLARPRALLLEGWYSVMMGSRAAGVVLWRRSVKEALRLEMPFEQGFALDRIRR